LKKALLALGNVLSPDEISTDESTRLSYGQDWTRFSHPDPEVVLRPRTLDQLQAIVRLAIEFQAKIVPSGGRTGLAGGAVASHREWVVSLERFKRIEPVDALDLSIRCEAGVTLLELQEQLRNSLWHWPVDLASKGSAQIGGLLSTNAGGLRVVRYGHVRRWVQSITLVDGTGNIQVLNGELDKNNSGYNFRELVIGAEGTLGIIASAQLKLTRRPRDLLHVLSPLNSIGECLELLAEVRNSALDLEAFEFFSKACVAAVLQNRADLKSLPEANWYCLWTWDTATEDPLSCLSTQPLPGGSLVATDIEAKDLWAYRESITESLALRGWVYKHDVSVPPRQLSSFVKDLEILCAKIYSEFEVFLFGHLADGNVHINIVGPRSVAAEEFLRECESKNADLYSLVKAYSGSCAAEHGIGILKKQELLLTRGPTQVEWMRLVKASLDPHQIFNPGKIFDKSAELHS
jgi:FAD/FMN-containing dehydrogenase